MRLFVYYKDTDAFEAEKQRILREQYIFMARRLWNIITVPAGSIMLLTGATLIFLNPDLLRIPWFHLKLTFLGALALYHLWCWKKVVQIKILNGNVLDIPNIKLRQYNEIATFLLFLVVTTVILKSLVIHYWWQLILGFLGIVFSIMLTVKLVNRGKKNKSEQGF